MPVASRASACVSVVKAMTAIGRKSVLLPILVCVSLSLQGCAAEQTVEDRVSAEVIARVIHSREESGKHAFNDRKELVAGEFVFDNQRHYRPGNPDPLPVNCGNGPFGVWYILSVQPWKHFSFRLLLKYRWTLEADTGEMNLESYHRSEYFNFGSDTNPPNANELRGATHRLRYAAISIDDKNPKNGVYLLEVLHEEDLLFQSRFRISGCDG